MKILVYFFKFFAVIISIALIGLIGYTSFAFGIQKTITKDKIKDYLFNINYTDSSIKGLVNTYEIKDRLGYTDYLAEIVIDEALATSNFKDDMADYLSTIIYENKETSDKKEIEKIVEKNIIKIDSKNRITKETETLMISSINEYVNDLIKDTISKNKTTTTLLKVINHFEHVNISKMITIIVLLMLLLIIFTISFIRPLKFIAIPFIICGGVFVSTKIIEGPIMNLFIKGETTLLDASKTLVNDLFNYWFETGVILLIVGIILYIIYKSLWTFFEIKHKKELENTKDLEPIKEEIVVEEKKTKKKAMKKTKKNEDKPITKKTKKKPVVKRPTKKISTKKSTKK